MVICVAVGCNSDSRDGKGLSFYKFPVDENLKKQWLIKIKRKNIQSMKHARICHLHFEEDCFKRDLQVWKCFCSIAVFLSHLFSWITLMLSLNYCHFVFRTSFWILHREDYWNQNHSIDIFLRYKSYKQTPL